MDIYVDILLAENILMNYLILWLTSAAVKADTSRIKRLAAATVGALYALLIFFPGYRVLYSMAMKVLLSFLIIIIAFTPQRFREFVKQLAVFYLVSFILGGAVLGLFYFTNTGTVTPGGVFLIGGIPWTILMGAGAVTVVIFRICLIPLYNLLERRSLHQDLTIRLGDKSVDMVGLLDTGNELYDPITNYPVMIVQYSAVKELLHEKIREIFEENLEDDLERVYKGFKEADWVSRLRLIPYSSLGKEKGMMLGFKADQVFIGNRCLEEVIVAVHTRPLSENGEYTALLNPDLFK